MKKSKKYIEGAGGKGGSGGGISNAPDTLVNNETVSILHCLGEGELNLYTGDGQSIYLNNVPLVNSDGSYNFGGYDTTTAAQSYYTGTGSTYFQFRSGTPTQTVIPMFPSTTNVVTVDQEATGGTAIPFVGPAPVIYEVSAADVDYCKVAINFPSGIQNVDSSGNIVGDTVQLALDVKQRISSTWTNAILKTVNYKASQSCTIQYKVNNPLPGSLWDIQFRRITPDNSSAIRTNQCYLYSVEETQAIQLPYNGIAICGLALDAATMGGTNASIPTMSFLVSKGAIAIPSNYNPATNAFSGQWNGTFSTGVTNDPAWCLYDLLTNAHYGCGLYGITAANVDAYSFYNASVFNNQAVPTGTVGVYEPRFTFDAPLQNRQDMLTTLQQIAGMMNGVLGVVNGIVTLFQDRPVSAPMYPITKANAIGSDETNPVYFTYNSNKVTDRTTAVQVTWTNPGYTGYLPTTSSVTDPTLVAKYGYNPYDLAAFGAHTMGQAQRAGRYYLYTQNYNTDSVSFTMGGLGLKEVNLYDVFELYDDDQIGRAASGRIVSATSTTVTLDQLVIIDGATPKISVWLADGVTYESHLITNGAGTYSTLNIQGTWSVIPTQYCVYGVTTSVAPRQFRVISLKYDNVDKTVAVTAQFYNQNNYVYVEEGIYIPPPIYTIPQQIAPLAPTNVVATPSTYLDLATNTVHYNVTVSWQSPASLNVSYQLQYRKDNGAYTTTARFNATSFELTDIAQGVYNFLVYAFNIAGNSSPPASVNYTLNTSGGGTTSYLAEVTNLEVTGTTGTAWTGTDLGLTWTNPVSNQGLTKDFVISFYTTSNTLLRSVTVPGVNGGSTQTYIYTFAMNLADTSNEPNRSIVVKVQGQDTMNDLTNGVTETFVNAPLPVPSNITATAFQQGAIITWTPETGTDVEGYLVWCDTNNGFTPSSGDVNQCGLAAICQLVGLTKTTTYYYRVAAYDVFGMSLAGTGLNVSSQLSFSTPSNVGVPSGPTLPTSGMVAGDLFYDTTDNRIYTFNGTIWVPAGLAQGASLPSTGINGAQFYDTSNSTLYNWNGTAWVPVGIVTVSSLPSTGVTGQVVYLSTDGNLYRWTGSAWTTAVPATSVTGQLTASQIASISAAQLTGTLTTTQIGPSTIQTGNLAASAVQSAQIAAGTIVAGNIATGTIVAGNIAANTILGSNIAAGTITANNLQAGSISAGSIAAGSITGSEISAGTITAANISTSTLTSSQIAAGTITAANIASATILAGNIAASTITGGNIAAGTIVANNLGVNSVTASAIAALTITGGKIAASTITAGNLSVSTLSAITANMGTITAGLVQNSTGTVMFDVTGGHIIFNNGTYMSVKGEGFGSGSQFLEWYGPTQSSASNYSACTTGNAISYQTTSGTAYFGGQVSYVSGTNSYGTYIKFPPDPTGRIYMWQFGTSVATGSDPASVTYPIAYAHMCVSVTANPIYSGGGLPAVVINGAPGLASFSFYSGGFAIFWQSIGY